MRASGASAGVESGGISSENAGHIDRRLSRQQRIADSRLFRETFNAGKSHAGRYLVMWLRYSGDACMRLAVIASKKTFRRSVDRSRAKRLLREAFRLNRHMFKGNVDVVLVARRRMGGVKRQVVDEDLLRVAAAAGILSGAEAVK